MLPFTEYFPLSYDPNGSKRRFNKHFLWISTFLLGLLYDTPYAIPFKMVVTLTQQLFCFLIKFQCFANSGFDVLRSVNM